MDSVLSFNAGVAGDHRPDEDAPDPFPGKCKKGWEISQPWKAAHFSPPSGLVGTPAHTNEASLSDDDRVISFPVDIFIYHLSSDRPGL